MTLARPQDQKDLEAIFRAGLAAVDPAKIVPTHLDPLLKQLTGGKIWIFGAGKASGAMAQAAEAFLLQEMPERFGGGLVVTKAGHGLPTGKIRVLEAAHPIPDERSVKAAGELLHAVHQVPAADLILFLLSGGASSLVCLPGEGIRLVEKQNLTDLLLRSGASIHEVNTLRKHCSAIKGGRLAQFAGGRKVVTLAISDVPGDEPSAIGSGMTVADPTTLRDCHDILQRYGLTTKVAPAVLSHLQKDASETPKEGDPAFARMSFQILARNQDAVDAARRKAKDLGYGVLEEAISCVDDVQKVSERLTVMIGGGKGKFTGPFAGILGGEPTVTVTGSGKGGRNTELALRLSVALSANTGTNLSFLSAGTDGTDGPTDAAGAFADETTLARARKMGLGVEDFLARNDSYTFFANLGDLFKTGPTGTNVMDLQIFIASCAGS